MNILKCITRGDNTSSTNLHTEIKNIQLLSIIISSADIVFILFGRFKSFTYDI